VGVYGVVRCPGFHIVQTFGSQIGGKVVSLTHWPLFTPRNLSVLISLTGWVNPRAMLQLEGYLMSNLGTLVGQILILVVVIVGAIACFSGEL
jgi:hypothetical protein